MDNSTQNLVEQVSKQMDQEIKTLKDLSERIDENTQNRKRTAEKSINMKKKRLLYLIGGAVAVIAIICISIVSAYNSGADQRKLNSSVEASLNTAQNYIEDGNFDEAIALMKSVPEEASRYSDAQYYIVKATEGKENKYLEKAENAVEEGDYKKAITILNDGMESLGESEDLSSKENDYIDDYVERAIEDAQDKMDADDYQGGIAMLGSVKEFLSEFNVDISNVDNKINEITDAAKNNILSKASEMASDGDYDTAISLLTDSMEVYGDEGEGEIGQALTSIHQAKIASKIGDANKLIEEADYDTAISLLTELENEYGSDSEEEIGQALTSARQAKITSKVEEANKLIEEADYDTAISLLIELREKYGRGSENEIENALKKARESKAISEVNEIAAKGNAEDTIKFVLDMDDSFREVEEIDALYTNAVETYVLAAVEECDKEIEAENYSTAGEIVDNALKLLPKNKMLNEKHNIIEGIKIEKEGFTGYMKISEQEDSFTFTTPVAGRYRFDLSDDNADARLAVNVFDQNGEHKAGDVLKNGQGINADLEADIPCKVVISYYDGTTNYTLKIGMPAPTIQLENLDEELEGEITYIGQIDQYEFTTTREGTYRFDLTDNNAEARYYMTLVDQRNNTIFNDSYRGDTGATAKLEAGVTYVFSVYQKENLAKYWVKIWEPNPVQEIDNTVNEVSDSIKYIDQQNIYHYTAPVKGRYRITSSDNNANSRYRLYIYDERNEQIAYHDNLSGGDGLTMDLDQGITYTLYVTYREGFCDYTLSFGVPNEIQAVEANTFAGSITYIDQQDRYYITPAETTNYEFSLGGGAEVLTRIFIFDSRDNAIADQVIGGGGSFRVDLNGGETYLVYVCYRDKLCDYSYSFKKYVEQQ